MPHPGRMTTQKAKDFKGTMHSLLAELGHYKFRLIAVIVFAVLSTIFNIAGPKVLAKATTALATGWVAKLRGTGSIDFGYIGKILLILLYSGMRVNELLKNEIVNVNFEEKYIYVPKNLAKNKESERKVPMHDRILPLVRSFVDNPHRGAKTNIILNDAGTVITYNNFCARDLPRINKALEHEHKFHDTRHTFASMGTEAGIPELYMQKIMGHKPKSILYNTYTHISMDELLSYVNKL